MLPARSLRNPHKSLILFLVMACIASAVSQARSLNQYSKDSKIDPEVSDSASSLSNPIAPSSQGFRPIPANRSDQAKRSTDDKRNPFILSSTNQVDGNLQLSGQNFAAGLRSVRLTGIVQEGSSLKALVEDGSRHESLSLGDHLVLGTLDGSGLRVVAISFDQGSISVSNGRSEYQLFISQ